MRLIKQVFNSKGLLSSNYRVRSWDNSSNCNFTSCSSSTCSSSNSSSNNNGLWETNSEWWIKILTRTTSFNLKWAITSWMVWMDKWMGKWMVLSKTNIKIPCLILLEQCLLHLIWISNFLRCQIVINYPTSNHIIHF